MSVSQAEKTLGIWFWEDTTVTLVTDGINATYPSFYTVQSWVEFTGNLPSFFNSSKQEESAVLPEEIKLKLSDFLAITDFLWPHVCIGEGEQRTMPDFADLTGAFLNLHCSVRLNQDCGLLFLLVRFIGADQNEHIENPLEEVVQSS